MGRICWAPLGWHKVEALRRLKSDSKLLSKRLIAVAGGEPRDLAAVLDELHESNIAAYADISSRTDLWIGHEAGPKEQASFATSNEHDAARWLHRTAIRLFPASKYAWKHSGNFSLVAILARRWNPF